MRRYVVLLLVSTVAGVAVWAALNFTGAKRWALRHSATDLMNMRGSDADLWHRGVEKVKAERGEPAGTSTVIEVPAELRHYEEKRWFLATQVAEVRKHNVPTCQDFLGLAAMIERGEMVDVPPATESYILFGVGQQADQSPFSRYDGQHSIDLYSDTQLQEEYARLAAELSKLQKEVTSLKNQAGSLKRRERAKRRELEKEINSRQQQLSTTTEDKKRLDEFYGQSESRQKLFNEYASLQTLARNFRGRSFDIGNPSDREALKVTMLSSLRTEAFKLLQELAASYHQAFSRPLPVSSLVRPEEYQRGLRRVNRNATNIDTPPHSTGLAFDINFRYMGAAEQNFLMSELARMERQGRIEVLREGNAANYHVFVFIDGTRPADTLITAALDETGAAVTAAAAPHAKKKPARTNRKAQKAKKTRSKPRAKTRRR